ncbi:MAG: hypothetical protein QXY39_07135 [Thermofilaceae archaeon]
MEEIVKRIVKAFSEGELLRIGNRSYVNAFKYPESRFDVKDLAGDPPIGQVLTDPSKLFTDKYVVPPTCLIFKFNERIYGKKFTGEIAGGLTDFLPVIQSALDTLPPEGGTVFVKRGAYDVETDKRITIAKSHVHLLSDGAILSHVGAPAYSATFYVPYTTSVEDIVIEGFKIVNPELSANHYAGIYISAPPAGQVTRDVVIRDVWMEGDRTQLWLGAHGLYNKTDESVRIKRVWIENLKIIHSGAFENPLRPVYINGAEEIHFTDSYIMGRDAKTVPHDPAKPGGIAAVCRKLYMRNVVVDGAHHNNFEGMPDDSIIEGCVFRDSDDCIDVDGVQRLIVKGCMGCRSADFISPEPRTIGGVTYPSEDITVVGNYIEDCHLLGGSGSRRIVVSNNVGKARRFIESYGGFEDVIVEGNMLLLTEFGYWNLGNSPDKGIFIRGNRLKLLPEADGLLMLAVSNANDLIQDVYWEDNEIWFHTTASDLLFILGKYVNGVKYYTVRRFFMRGNVFRNCRRVSINTVSDHSDYYVWQNCNMSYLDGGGYEIRFNFYDTGEYGRMAQDAISMVADFDASIAGEQTKTIHNYVSLLPPRGEADFHAIASIRSAPSGWAGWVKAKPNPTAPYRDVDVTLVTTSTATGTVYVDIMLSEAYSQGYGYTEPRFPKWRR